LKPSTAKREVVVRHDRQTPTRYWLEELPERDGSGRFSSYPEGLDAAEQHTLDMMISCLGFVHYTKRRCGLRNTLNSYAVYQIHRARGLRHADAVYAMLYGWSTNGTGSHA